MNKEIAAIVVIAVLAGITAYGSAAAVKHLTSVINQLQQVPVSATSQSAYKPEMFAKP